MSAMEISCARSVNERRTRLLAELASVLGQAPGNERDHSLTVLFTGFTEIGDWRSAGDLIELFYRPTTREIYGGILDKHWQMVSDGLRSMSGACSPL